MASLENDRFLRALLREPVDRTPLWMMRQAGRYLPEYREIRAEAGSFMNLCTNPELACEVTLQPLRRYAMDAAILFSDILTVPDALGLGLYFSEGEGPRFERPISTAAEINALDPARAASELGYVMDAVSLIRKELKGSIPLIGFAGSPWTLATYMVEGGSSKDFAKVKSLAFNEPELMHQLLSKLATSVAAYLSHYAYREFSLRYMTEIIDQLPREADGRRVPVIVFTKGGGQWLEAIADCGADAVGLDWTTDIGAARERVGDRVCLQGNMDPTLLNASPERIREEVAQILTSFGEGSGHVFNLGHGITPGINPDHVAAMVDAVVALSPAYH
jgi:uroporphyrinogen decarboxylase